MGYKKLRKNPQTLALKKVDKWILKIIQVYLNVDEGSLVNVLGGTLPITLQYKNNIYGEPFKKIQKKPIFRFLTLFVAAHLRGLWTVAR